MKKLTIDDILPLPEYEKKREVLKRDILRVKESRRVHLGDRITLLFENRETVRMQIQEMMRVEHIYDPKKSRTRSASTIR